MEFVDRQSKYPNRVLITPESGSPFYATLTRADEPIVAGTPLNAATMNALVDSIEPPMEVGVAYRTNEKFKGMPVYKKLVSLGAGLAIDDNYASKKQIPHDEGDVSNPGVITVIRCEGIAIDNNSGASKTLPEITFNDSEEISSSFVVNANYWCVVMSCNYDTSNYDECYATIYFVKNT